MSSSFLRLRLSGLFLPSLAEAGLNLNLLTKIEMVTGIPTTPNKIRTGRTCFNQPHSNGVLLSSKFGSHGPRSLISTAFMSNFHGGAVSSAISLELTPLFPFIFFFIFSMAFLSQGQYFRLVKTIVSRMVSLSKDFTQTTLGALFTTYRASLVTRSTLKLTFVMYC